VSFVFLGGRGRGGAASTSAAAPAGRVAACVQTPVPFAEAINAPHQPPRPTPTPPDFDGHAWYQALFDYGVAAGADPALAPEDDADSNLVPQLVESLVLPQALEMVKR
jgi:hypothetical protein